jgi:prolyl oligopeptidase
MNRTALLLLATILITISCKKKLTIQDIAGPYPTIEPDSAIDVFWGKTVIDPYRNLENLEDSVVMSWYKDQNMYFDTIISHITGSDSLKAELNLYYKDYAHWINFPRPVGKKTFYGGYSLEKYAYNLNYMSSIKDSAIIIFDVDSLNKVYNEFYVINYYEPSPNGDYIAFGMSPWGSEQDVIHIIEVETKKLLPDRLKHAWLGNPQWLPDGSGFFYQEYIKSKDNDGSKIRSKCVKLHLLRTAQARDKEILSISGSPQIEIHDLDVPFIYVYPESDLLLAALDHGTDSYSALYYAKLTNVLSKSSNNIEWTQLFYQVDKVTNYGLVEHTLYYLTFNNNPNGSIKKLQIENPSNVQTLLESGDNVLSDMVLNREGIFTTSLENGTHFLKFIDFKDHEVKNIKLPSIGTLKIRPEFVAPPFYQNSNDLFFTFNSWNADNQILLYNMENNKVEAANLVPKGKYSEMENLRFKQVEVKSHDGTLVPLTIVYADQTKFDGLAPTILKAYGFFNISNTPEYSKERRAWFNKGGIYAVAHVRGGGEKGEDWYRGGYKATKPNSWKDLIACAEYLIENNYTSSEKLAVTGGSAGAITVGRAIIEKPKLFKAAVISVGDLNVLRREEAASNSAIVEYGTVNDSIEFGYLYNMDVYQNLNENEHYPSILFTIGLNDPRVAPWASGKAAAYMQRYNRDNIVLLKASNDGHSSAFYSYDAYAFLLWQLGYEGFELKQ